MSRLKDKITLLISLLLILLTPTQTVFAAAEAVAATDASSGLSYRVAYTNGRYAVYMRPNATPEELNITLTAQVTLKVPHGTDGQKFAVADIQNGVAGTSWAVTSRVDAPAEDKNADYISFTVEFPEGNHQAYAWQADQEVEVFSFSNGGACLGTVSLLENSDAFMAAVNSAGTNPGNQIDVLGFREGNLYLGTYGSAATCNRVIDIDSLINKIFMPLVNR